MNLVIFAAVLLSYPVIIVVNHVNLKGAEREARREGFLKGYRRCATAHRTFVRATRNNHNQTK